jgi:hypothetical protein
MGEAGAGAAAEGAARALLLRQLWRLCGRDWLFCGAQQLCLTLLSLAAPLLLQAR